jgi:hypothetical protein
MTAIPDDDEMRAEGKEVWMDLLTERGRLLRNALGGCGGLVEQARLCGATDLEIMVALGVSEQLFETLFGAGSS